jgi:pilus assembly protein CpaB
MKRSALVLGLALVLATVGTLAVVYYVRQADARALAGKDAVTVLVVEQLVPAGTTAGDAQRAGVLRVEPMPADSVPAEALGEIGPDVAPLVAGADIQPGQLVLRSLFVDRKPVSNPLPIPAGKVAVTIQLGVPQEVAGYVVPGTEVAVFDTDTETGRTRVLIPRIAVLAVGPAPTGGQAATQSTPDGSAGAPLTFAASAEEAGWLILHSQTSSLHLALLRDDSTVTPDQEVDQK